MRWASLGAQDSRKTITHANDPPILDVRLHLLFVLGDWSHILLRGVHLAFGERWANKREQTVESVRRDGRGREKGEAVRNLNGVFALGGDICAEAILAPMGAKRPKRG